MSYRITKEHVWVGAIPDQADALAQRLRALRDAGLNLELILGRQTGPGEGLMFIAPLRTMAEIDAAEGAGLARSESLRTIRIEGPNARGVGARISTALSEAGLNVREYAAAAVGDKCVTHIAFDTDRDSDRAMEILRQALAD